MAKQNVCKWIIIVFLLCVLSGVVFENKRPCGTLSSPRSISCTIRCHDRKKKVFHLFCCNISLNVWHNFVFMSRFSRFARIFVAFGVFPIAGDAQWNTVNSEYFAWVWMNCRKVYLKSSIQSLRFQFALVLRRNGRCARILDWLRFVSLAAVNAWYKFCYWRPHVGMTSLRCAPNGSI